MKTLKNILITLVFLSFISTLDAQEFKVVNDKSKITWTGKAAFTSYSLSGNLKVLKGKLIIENDILKTLEISIDMKSLDHKNGDLKSHLRSKDFFEVKKYKTANFEITKPVKIINGKAIIVGLMKIKNTIRQEEIQAEILIKNSSVSIQFNTKLDRTKYGVKFNSPSFFKKMKENAIADLFILKGDVLFK